VLGGGPSLMSEHDADEHDDALDAFSRLGVAMRTGAVLAGRAADLTLAQYLVLSHLVLHESLTPSALARRLAMSSGGLTPSLAQLEVFGLVEREPHPSDGRSALLRLSDRGRDVIFDPSRELIDDLSSAVRGLEPQTHAALVEVLEAWTVAYEAHGERLRERIAGSEDGATP
jgi:DNA-binding MarR family transcriptional regulator